MSCISVLLKFLIILIEVAVRLAWTERVYGGNGFPLRELEPGGMWEIFYFFTGEALDNSMRCFCPVSVCCFTGTTGGQQPGELCTGAAKGVSVNFLDK